MEELWKIHNRVVRELYPEDREKMRDRIDQLMKWLPDECENEGGMFFLA